MSSLGARTEIRKLDQEVLRILESHFLYLENLLTDDELRVLIGASEKGTWKVANLYRQLGMTYGATQTAFRRLDLKGFARKIAKGTYEPLDPLFQNWLLSTRS